MEMKETQSIFLSIKRDVLDFDEKKFLSDVKWGIQNLHYFLRENKSSKAKAICLEKVVNKLMDQKEKFKITDNIDNASVQYTKLLEYSEEEQCIKVYVSIYFYDNANNNDCQEEKEKYWNDIWIVTYKRNNLKEYESYKCGNCGASMVHEVKDNILKCNYCGNEKYFTRESIDWIISDIECR